MRKNKILLLEDDINLSETIEEFLEEEGFDVVCAYDGIEAEDIIYENSFDVLLLDVNVPGVNGFELLKKLRESGNETPAIYITSLNSTDDLSDGFESGCDDYIRKPFELKELLLRLKSIIKRGFFHKKANKIKIYEDCYYDVDNNQLIKGGEKVTLNNKEDKLLKLLLQNQNQVVSHEKIYETLWGYDETYSDNSLRAYIKNLRKILGKDTIVSIKKLGYKIITE
ncbi:MAG: response regulator transcription factor [Epsilonproteobacteria bacterium]|nr:response regulator transcription factor [Campylobacterota bacterium]